MKTRYVLTRPARNRYLVRERDRRRLRELGRVAAAVFVLGVAAMGYTWLHLSTIGAGYRIDELDRGLDELQRLERHLELEVAYQSCPPRVAARARDELEMRPPVAEDLVFVEASR